MIVHSFSIQSDTEQFW